MGGVITKLFDVVFVKWLTVGILSFLLDYILFLFMYDLTFLGKFVTLCNAISMGTATILNYYLHRYWTFINKKIEISRIKQYLCNFVLLWCLSTLLLKLLLVIGLAPSYAKFITAISTVPISYLTLRFLVFNSTRYV
jgi:putative flippase GtrA